MAPKLVNVHRYTYPRNTPDSIETIGHPVRENLPEYKELDLIEQSVFNEAKEDGVINKIDDPSDEPEEINIFILKNAKNKVMCFAVAMTIVPTVHAELLVIARRLPLLAEHTDCDECEKKLKKAYENRDSNKYGNVLLGHVKNFYKQKLFTTILVRLFIDSYRDRKHKESLANYFLRRNFIRSPDLTDMLVSGNLVENYTGNRFKKMDGEKIVLAFRLN